MVSINTLMHTEVLLPTGIVRISLGTGSRVWRFRRQS